METVEGYLPVYMSMPMMLEFTGENLRTCRALVRCMKKENKVKKITTYIILVEYKITMADLMWQLPSFIKYPKHPSRKPDQLLHAQRKAS